MDTLFQIVTELVSKRPGAWAERLTPWVMLIVGGAMILLMVYSCAWAPQ